MPTKKKRPQDIIDREPTDEELVVQEAPSLELVAVDEHPKTNNESRTLPLKSLTRLIFEDDFGIKYQLDEIKRGQFTLRIYYAKG